VPGLDIVLERILIYMVKRDLRIWSNDTFQLEFHLRQKI
jgi:hypothetical protein